MKVAALAAAEGDGEVRAPGALLEHERNGLQASPREPTRKGGDRLEVEIELVLCSFERVRGEAEGHGGRSAIQERQRGIEACVFSGARARDEVDVLPHRALDNRRVAVQEIANVGNTVDVEAAMEEGAVGVRGVWTLRKE